MRYIVSGAGTAIFNLNDNVRVNKLLTPLQKKTLNPKSKINDNKRIHIFQDFDFNGHCSKIRVSDDGRYVCAIGHYPPQLKMFTTHDLTSKFTRHYDGEGVDVTMLSDDYRKFVILQRDRWLEFHSQGGVHHKVRVPNEGTNLSYFKDSAKLHVSGTSSDVYRLDLELGQYLEPLRSATCNEINFLVENPSLPFYVTGGDGGMEAWDKRQDKTSIAILNPLAKESFKCASFTNDGFKICIGTSDGICRVYDIRSYRHFCERDQGNGLPIIDIHCIQNQESSQVSNLDSFGGPVFLSSDRRSIKLWASTPPAPNPKFSNLNNISHEYTRPPPVKSFTPIANIHPTKPVNSTCMYPNSGLLFVAQDSEPIGTYFIPLLGIAPKWLSFLDGFVEELEEQENESLNENPNILSNRTVYDGGFHFITRDYLVSSGLQNLIKTSSIRPHLHGYLIDDNLYQTIKSTQEPIELEKYRKQKLKDKIESKKQMRIQLRTVDAPKVNVKLAHKLKKAASKTQKGQNVCIGGDVVEVQTGTSSRKSSAAAAILSDDRFSALFVDPDYDIELEKATKQIG